MRPVFPLLFIVTVLLFSGCAEKPKACTEEAKLCQNGSSVGRNSSLNCEFDPCPDSLRTVFDGNSFVQGEKIAFSVRNPLPYSVFLPGCNAFKVEKLSGSAWILGLQLKECVWEGFAVELKPGELKNFDFVLNSTGKYRISFEASIGCKTGAALSQANCLKSFVSKSKEFNVEAARPTEQEMKSCGNTSDCVLVNADCCGCNQGGARTAINKLLELQWQAQLNCSPDLACIQMISNDPSCRADAAPDCIQFKCQVIVPPGE